MDINNALIFYAALAFVFVIINWVVACFAIGAAYRNGVTDGYGYSQEPGNPGYQAAGNYLVKHMAHRWPELKVPRYHSLLDDLAEVDKECREIKARIKRGPRRTDGHILP